ncbi:MAG: hypothetical protein ACFFAN_08980, partial [Promethearchaeota archaeon]
MCLFKVAVYRNYIDSLLNHLSKINNVHIKSKPKEESQIISKSEEEDILLKKIKKLRQDTDDLFKKLKINEINFQRIKVEKKEKFIVKDLQELSNHILEEINFYANRIYELERYIAKARIELENIKTIRECYKFLEKFNLNRFSLSYFKQLNFKVYTTFSKNLPNLKTLFEFSVFPNFYQINDISNDRIVFFVIYPKDKEKDLKERIRLIHAEEVNILKKYLMYDKINFERINKEINFIEKTLSKYQRELFRIREDNLLKFAAINELVQNIEEYYWAKSQFEDISSTRSIIKFF